MQVVLRPVNDRFLTRVVFPALQMGVIEAAPALAHLLEFIADEQTRSQLELLLERGVEGSFFGLQDEKWSATIYRLLFQEWQEGSDGWLLAKNEVAYAGDWELTLHLALMLEDEHYPYWDAALAQRFRNSFLASPFIEQGLASLVAGVWHPVPAFPPDQVLTVQGRGEYRPTEGVARADWSFRGLRVVNQWAAQLPNALSRLLEQESRRLKPVEAPEKHEVLQFWLGRLPAPPTLAVAFSGLGAASHHWIRELGYLARVIRSASAREQGLTAVISQRGGTDSVAT